MGMILASRVRRKVLTAAMGALIGCALPTFARAGDILNPRQSGATLQDSKKATNQAAETKIVTDGTGRRVAIPVNVRRIVSLAPNLTETVYALGLEDKLVGDTTYCDTPAAAREKPHIGAPLTPSLEAIVALHPDLVLATAINRWETVDAITKLGIRGVHRRAAHGARHAGIDCDAGRGDGSARAGRGAGGEAASDAG